MLTMDVSGVVRDADGHPVAGAVVLLRESSTTRIGANYAQTETSDDLYLREVADVLARTTSDSSGRFEFRDVEAPGYPPQYRIRNWTGDVVAAHPEFGICSVRIRGDETAEQKFEDLDATLQKTASLSGSYVTVDGEPVTGAIVTLGRLIESSELDRWYEGFDLQSSQLTPRAVTDGAGSFRFDHIPESMVANLWVYDKNSAGASAMIGTSSDVDLSRLKESPISRFARLFDPPNRLVADPGVFVRGVIRDEAGGPVADAKVAMGSVLLHRTDRAGAVKIRVSSLQMESYRNRPATTSEMPIHVHIDADRGYLPTTYQMPIDDIDAGKPFEISLQKGVRVEGRVVDSGGTPIEGIVVWNTSKTSPGRVMSDDNGRYEIQLPAANHTVLFATDKDGFKLPSVTEAYRLREKPDGLLTLTVDLTDGQTRKLPDTVIPRADSLQVIASLPDGAPAKNAKVVIRDEETVQSGTFSMPRTVERSSVVSTNSLGRADLQVRGVLSPKAYVDLSLLQNGVAFHASAKVTETVNGVLTLVMLQSPILEGRVLLDGQPFAGVTVSVGESQPMPGRSFGAFRTTNHQSVTTGADGYYRLPVARDKRYSVSISAVPGMSSTPGIGYGGQSSGAEKISIRDFNFRRGSETIAGRVVDSLGTPVAEARVDIRRDRDVIPNLWIGHRDESAMTTNAEGYFELKNVPRGTYQLSVSGKRPADRSQRPPRTTVSAATGQLNVTVTLSDGNAVAPLPRLKPVRIEKVVPER